jgi:tRNA (guanine-N7-)-methyltransferase
MNQEAHQQPSVLAKTRSVKKPRMALTRNLLHPTEYVHLMNGEFSKWAFNEERGPGFKGRWREDAFGVAANAPIDLEIGTGNGYHFAHMAKARPDRNVLGIELKFKPLIQSIRRALLGGTENARVLRYDAGHLHNLFAENELDNVYIHFPDPWSKKRQKKHRLIQDEFLVRIHQLMRVGSFLDFKTDSADYFEWAIERFHSSPFKVVRETRNLHSSEWKDENFVTHFESLFLAQGLPIHYARLVKN